MTHPVVTRSEWLEARRTHLADEKAFTRARDALSARRRALPWLRIDKEYRFRTQTGECGLDDLFGPCTQLIVQHFMFGPDWEQGCPSCSFWADGYNGLQRHIAQCDAALVTVSNTSIDKITRYRERMGWSFDWVSSEGSDFNRDFGVQFSAGDRAGPQSYYNFGTSGFPVSEAPGITVFYKPEPGMIVQTYATFARGLDMMNAAYHYVDLLPKGRDEGDGIMAWLRRHDEYDTATD